MPSIMGYELAEFFVRWIQMWLPTFFVRFLVRWFLRLFVGWRMRGGDVVVQQIKEDRRERVHAKVTTEVEVTNDQLYANDPQFFVDHLGPKLKYSACEWPSSKSSLAEAESFTIQRYQDIAGLAELPDGARVLELGCGWGSLSLSNAARFPNLKFTSFSNSAPQIEYIKGEAKKQGLSNLTVMVEDYALFVNPETSHVAPVGAPLFDAVMGIETVEHAQNIGALLSGVALRLKPGGKLFVHSLLHQSASYCLDRSSWMGRNFFTGGSIIALNSYFHLAPPDLHLAEVIPVNGHGYALTLLAWLDLMEAQRHKMVAKYGRAFYEGFRMFYISCAEAFDANNGAEYMCGYYLFVKR